MALPLVRYVICSVPRCGSTLLARALGGMHVGAPDEFLNVVKPVDGEGLVEREGLSHCHSEDDLRDYLESLQARYTVSDVFGLKVHYAQLAQYPFLLANLPMLLPGARYIAITRRDSLRQAISLVRAGQTQQWASTLPARRQPWFDRDAIDAILEEIAAQTRGWKTFFQSHAIHPFRIVYEDFVRDYQGTLTRLTCYLGVGTRSVPAPPLERQADVLTEEWVRRYWAEAPTRSLWRSLFHRLFAPRRPAEQGSMAPSAARMHER